MHSPNQTAPIDYDRCSRAMLNIGIRGNPEPAARQALIEEAIGRIQKDPMGALQERYMGLKDYAQFSDQREDHPYGYGPKHGSIVFEIEKTDHARRNHIPLGTDETYFLECARDFGRPRIGKDERGQDRHGNIATTIQEWAKAKAALEMVEDAMKAARVESHARPPAAQELAPAEG